MDDSSITLMRVNADARRARLLERAGRWLVGVFWVLSLGGNTGYSAEPLHVESHTRLTSTLVQGGSLEAPCEKFSQNCVSIGLLEQLGVSSQPDALPGLRLQGLLQYARSSVDAPFTSLAETYSNVGDLKILSLQAAWLAPRHEWQVRLGRLSRWDADPLLFDGAELRFSPRGPLAGLGLEATLFGGVWTVLDADERAQALYGSLFPQQLLALDAQGLSVAVEVKTPSPGLMGLELAGRPHQTLRLRAADAFYLDRHHLRLSGLWTPRPAWSVWGEARTLDVQPRDLRVGVEFMRAEYNTQWVLIVLKTFEGQFPLSPLEHGLQAPGSARLLLGNPAPTLQLSLEGLRPLPHQLLAGARLALVTLDAADEQAYQRAMLELELSAHWQPLPRLSLRGEVVEVLAPQAGTFSEDGEVVLDDGEGDGQALIQFPNLSGEGEEAMLDALAQLQLRLGSTFYLQLGGGLLWVQRAYTAFVVLEQGAGGYAWLQGQWMPSTRAQLSLRYSQEQPLEPLLAGENTRLHQLSLRFTARF
ncbi:MAG: hypothetical protein ACKO6N_14765 [Myxococcota bacterium]